jgi:hypothetical protein
MPAHRVRDFHDANGLNAREVQSGGAHSPLGNLLRECFKGVSIKTASYSDVRCGKVHTERRASYGLHDNGGRASSLQAARPETMMNSYDRLPSRRRILMSGAFAATCLMPPMDDAFAQQSLAPTPSLSLW